MDAQESLDVPFSNLTIDHCGNSGNAQRIALYRLSLAAKETSIPGKQNAGTYVVCLSLLP